VKTIKLEQAHFLASSHFQLRDFLETVLNLALKENLSDSRNQ